MNEILERYNVIPLGNICDANGRTGAMDCGIKAIDINKRLVGYAYTVKGRPGDNVSIHMAMLEAPKDSVLVVDMNGYCKGGHFGEIMATACMAHGIRGLVIDGSIRDSQEIQDLGFPVFARGICPNGTTKYDVGQRGIRIICGGIDVDNGDLIIGSRDGVVVVKKDRIEEVLVKAEAIMRKEEGIVELLRKGETTADIYRFESLEKARGNR